MEYFRTWVEACRDSRPILACGARGIKALIKVMSSKRSELEWTKIPPHRNTQIIPQNLEFWKTPFIFIGQLLKHFWMVREGVK